MNFGLRFRPVNCHMTVTGCGQFSAAVTRIDTHHLWLQRARKTFAACLGTGDSSHAHSHPVQYPEPGPTIGWRRADIAANEVLPAHAGIVGWHILPAAANWGSASLPTDRLAEASIALLGRDVTPSRDSAALVVPPLALERLRRLHAAAGQLAEPLPKSSTILTSHAVWNSRLRRRRWRASMQLVFARTSRPWSPRYDRQALRCFFREASRRGGFSA